ncbi:MAG: murein biosynthesis integral membrane protein MurJ [Candidatus Campbellbacteria bacterium]|nr:murein biosynthesis integral membrane protein MurJ [Candidatus Campbellbacteria bacterium]
MIQRFFALFSTKIEGLHQAAYTIAIFSLASQVLGLIRDRLLAHAFGASATLDVYYAAFRIPDVVFASIASFVSLFVLIPFLAKKIDDREDARRFLSEITTVFTFFMVGVSAVLWFFIPALSDFLYPGFSPEQHDTLVMLTRILLLSPIFLGLSNIVASVTQITKKFFVYAISPLVYNIGIIVGVVVLYPMFGIQGLTYGVVLGAVLHLCVQIPTLIKERLVPKLTRTISWPDIKLLVMVSIPRTMTLAFDQIILMILIGMASRFPEGSIAVFTFALNINLAPLTIIGVSYSVAAFPTLVNLFSEGKRDVFIDHLLVAVRHILFWSLPATVLFIVLRAHIVRLLLGSGAFDWSATRLTAAVMAMLVVSLVAHSLVLLFVRGYYAAGKTARPFWINVSTSVLTLLTAYGSVWLYRSFEGVRFFVESLFRISDVSGAVIIMLSFGYTVGMMCNATAFWLLFRHDFGGHLPSSMYKTFWQSFAASIIAGAGAYMTLHVLEPFINLDSFAGVLVHGVSAGIVGVAAGVLVLIGLKNNELAEMWQTVHVKFWRTKPIAPSPEEL